MTLHLADYSQFKFKNDMDKAVKQHVDANLDILNDSDRAVLDVIRRDFTQTTAPHI